ncbi:MAG TPA: Uma2 family endonuclease [Gemmataceae bacterium]|jgi:Uma2 family endonuclease|nr:Uma2 family endonuclease [Gemmataceae bacterium]
MSVVQIPTEQRFIFRAVDWLRYKAIAQSVGDRFVRLTYDGRNLEIMTVSQVHERIGELLGRLLSVLTLELGIPWLSAGSTTFDREDVEKGLEPDKCYYIENEPLIRPKDKVDLSIDPPPDLALEIEISRSALNRLNIYAALRVPEVWRCDETMIKVHILGENGQYQLSETSRHFPFLPVQELVRFVQRRHEVSENDLIRQFLAWVREQMAKDWK